MAEEQRRTFGGQTRCSPLPDGRRPQILLVIRSPPFPGRGPSAHRPARSVDGGDVLPRVPSSSKIRSELAPTTRWNPIKECSCRYLADRLKVITALMVTMNSVKKTTKAGRTPTSQGWPSQYTVAV